MWGKWEGLTHNQSIQKERHITTNLIHIRTMDYVCPLCYIFSFKQLMSFLNCNKHKED
jgi:hypothetical protein